MITKATKKLLKQYGLDEMNITQEDTARYWINQRIADIKAKQEAARDAELAKQANAEWPAEIGINSHCIETCNGVMYTISGIDDTYVYITTEYLRGHRMRKDYFLDSVKRGYEIVRGYTPEELKDGKLRPIVDGDTDDFAGKHQDDYEKCKELINRIDL